MVFFNQNISTVSDYVFNMGEFHKCGILKFFFNMRVTDRQLCEQCILTVPCIAVGYSTVLKSVSSFYRRFYGGSRIEHLPFQFHAARQLLVLDVYCINLFSQPHQAHAKLPHRQSLVFRDGGVELVQT